MDGPPTTQPATQRTLAAILFTDVVGFSALMQKAEERTVRLLERDFGEMRRLCAEHEGAVLKTTGDGLLCTFSSAVKAVSCAVAMQRSLGRAGTSADEILQHRIGIHLGDVLVQQQDVMGDGVNIASRLQGEADPGGICISQTVYDVVKNKLAIQTTYIGARELKNISEAVPAYRVLIEAESGAGAAAGAKSPTSPQSPAHGKGPAHQSVWPWVIAGATVVVAGAAVLLLTRRNAGPTAVAPAPVAASTPAPAPAAPAATTPTQPKPSADPNAAFERELAEMPTDRKQFMNAAHQRFLRRYEFAEFGEAVQHEAEATGTQPPAGMERWVRRLVDLRAWMLQRLAGYDEQHPLHAVAVTSTPRPWQFTVFGISHDEIGMIQNSAVAHRPIAELTPNQFGGIVLALFAHEGRPTPDLLQGAEAFARVFHLEPMQNRLADLRQNQPGESGREKRPRKVDSNTVPPSDDAHPPAADSPAN